MFTVSPILGTSQPHRISYSGTLAAAVALVSILTVLFLPSTSGSIRPRPTAIGSAANVPLIQYRGTGQPPAAPASHSTSEASPPVGLLRTEHSYGAVP
jgi:hypothetical protein